MDKNNSCIGLQSLVFNNPAYIQEYYSIAGKKEGEGPLGKYFSHIESDDMFGSNTWEEAESSLQAETVQCLLHKAKLEPTSYHKGCRLIERIAEVKGDCVETYTDRVFTTITGLRNQLKKDGFNVKTTSDIDE